MRYSRAVTTIPPHPTLADARHIAGAEGVRALLAWVAQTFAPPAHTLTDAARALGATTPEQARSAARDLRRAAASVGYELPVYPAGAPRGSVAWSRAMAARGVPTKRRRGKGGAVKRSAATRPRARKRTPAEMDAALAAHDAARCAAESVRAEARARREDERAKRLEEGRVLSEQRRVRREARDYAKSQRKARREWRKAMRAWRRSRPSLPVVVARGTAEQRLASLAARIRAEKALARWEARRPVEP